MRRIHLGIALAILAATDLSAQTPSSLALSKKIDELVSARAQQDGIPLAPRADSAVLFRRLHLDLAGTIPDLVDARDYIENQAADKHVEWVDRLLEHKNYQRHWAAVWRNILLPRTTNQQFFQNNVGFETWMRDHLQRQTPYHQIVREILTQAGGVNRFGQANGSQIFFQNNENKAENLAATTSRVFLGIKLDCAQCHSHPFAAWSRDQFWEFAAFFSGSTPGIVRPFMPNAVPVKVKEIQIPGTQKIVKAKFLTGDVPPAEGNALEQLADWVISPKNPYFAKATVDHLWIYFFGVSLMEPVMEETTLEQVAHAELLELLAKEFVASNYDVKFLLRAIVHSQTYQRASEGAGNPKDSLYFTRMPLRGMTAEQFFDSFAEATTYKDDGAAVLAMRPMGFGMPATTPRGEFLQKFASSQRGHETQTSIQQALFLMNGKFVQERTDVSKNPSLKIIVESKVPIKQKLETLYLLTLSRLPRPEERQRLEAHLQEGIAKGETSRAWSDIFWALINSAEFRLNH